MQAHAFGTFYKQSIALYISCIEVGLSSSLYLTFRSIIIFSGVVKFISAGLPSANLFLNILQKYLMLTSFLVSSTSPFNTLVNVLDNVFQLLCK